MRERLYSAVLASVLCWGCSPQDLESIPQPELGQQEQDIIGGTAAAAGQFPWQTRMTVNGSHYCGGSLIHPKWVLTAGHCVDGISPGSTRIILGDRRINLPEPTEQSHTVRRFILHPGFHYESGAPVNDVALVELDTPATLNGAVQTIALQSTTANNVSHTVSGWGWTSANANQASNLLMTATLPVVGNASCNAAPLARDLLGSELCAGFLNGVRGGCHGDSGGPLVTQGNPVQLVGVVSWGRGGICNTYTVFSRVSSFVSWIDSQMNCVPCPMSGSWYDGANCYAGTPPSGTTPFAHNGSLYYSPVRVPTCPMSGSGYDGANCYVGTPPSGTTPFTHNGNLYYSPVAGNQCPMSGSWYDGANCYAGTPPSGTTPFAHNGSLYYSPVRVPTCPMSGSGYDGANCYVGTPPSGTTPFTHNGNLYYSPVCQP
ncbi:serine protease [Cystobacter fuscus]|uniref:serine protease n=1 Tax=Cystobacter fuscus TaxID=43 RepID=UPI002B2C38E1|nr:serine protease [Cystobacter fuscus]